jgi:regulator of RNase E activity RraB
MADRVQLDILSGIAAHHQRNDVLGRQLITKNVDLNQARFIECHFWTPDKSAADRLSTRLGSQGFSVLASRQAVQPVGKNNWNLELVVDRSLKEALSVEFTENLVQISAEENSIYDGWGVEI